MKRSNKALFILILIFLVITAIGAVYSLSVQKNQIDEVTQKLNHQKSNFADVDKINIQLKMQGKKRL